MASGSRLLWESASRSRPVSGIVLAEGPRTSAPWNASLPRFLLFPSQVIVKHLQCLIHIDSICDLVLQIQERLMVWLIHESHESVSLVQVASIEALPHSFEVIWILITFDNLHLNQGHLVAASLAQLAQEARDLVGKIAEVPWIHHMSGIITILIADHALSQWRSSSIPECCGAGAVECLPHLVLTQISLNALRYHAVQNIVRNIVQRLLQRRSHLITHLSLQKIAEALAL